MAMTMLTLWVLPYRCAGQLDMRDLPCPSVNVNFLPRDFTRLNGARHLVPRTSLDSLLSKEWFRVLVLCLEPFLSNGCQ